MKNTHTYVIIILMCFPLIGLAQSNKQEIPVGKLKVEILEKKITSDKVKIIDNFPTLSNGQYVNSSKQIERSPSKNYIFIIATIKLTNISGKTITLDPTQELVAKNQDGIANKLKQAYLNYKINEPNTFQNAIFENGFCSLFNYKLKKDDTATITIIVELPVNSDLIIEYVIKK
jgi:hypothetical protein